MNAPQPRTQNDDYNRLIAVAFEERVNAQVAAQNAEQRVSLAMQVIDKLREELKEAHAKAAAVATPAPVESEGGEPA